jgi:hypothetical protein
VIPVNSFVENKAEIEEGYRIFLLISFRVEEPQKRSVDDEMVFKASELPYF